LSPQADKRRLASPERIEIALTRLTGRHPGSRGVRFTQSPPTGAANEVRGAIALAVGVGGQEVADGRGIDATEERATQQRSGTAAVRGGELPGRGPEKCLGDESARMEVGQARCGNDQNDSSSSSPSKRKRSSSMEDRSGMAEVRMGLESWESKTKFEEARGELTRGVSVCGVGIGDERTFTTRAMVQTRQSQPFVQSRGRITPRFPSTCDKNIV
jgi:hypothetical protein